MNNSQAAAAPVKPLSAGVLLLVSGAVALFQMSSLLLGPVASRQLDLSLSVPMVDLEDAPTSLGGQLDAVLGALVASSLPDYAVASIISSHQSHAVAPQTTPKPVPGPATIAPVVTVQAGPSDSHSKTAHGRHDDRGQDGKPEKEHREN
jgi:hypothetical protein